MTEKENIGVFIDGPSLYIATKETGKIDFKQFIKWILHNRKAKTVEYFNAITKDDTPLLPFFKYLKAVDIRVIIKKTKKFRKSVVTLRLSINAMSKHEEIDRYIFVTDDYEVLLVINELQKKNKKIEIIGSEKAHKILKERFAFRPIETFIKEQEATINEQNI